MIKDPDGLRGYSRWAWAYIIHASHLAPFDRPYVEPQDITIEGTEEMPKYVQVLEWCSKKQCKVDD